MYIILKNKAFTLAEVLITLLIIGVVASLIIPSIINDTQEAQYKAAWKKNYAEFSNAARLVVMDKGNFNNDSAYAPSEQYFSTAVPDYFNQYMHFIKRCYGSNHSECWSNDDIGYANDWHVEYAIMPNGALVKFVSHWLPLGCTYQFTCNFGGANLKAKGRTTVYECFDIYVDVNGHKGPNIAGKDIFALSADDISLYPFGSDYDCKKNTCDPSSNEPGLGCSAEYLK